MYILEQRDFRLSRHSQALRRRMSVRCAVAHRAKTGAFRG
jgi:hypothetical protein